MDVAGVGGANVDIHGRSTNPIVMRDSNPGTMHLTTGGVTRNILENLAKLGLQTTLLSVIGSDAYGQMILESCHLAGVDTSHLAVREGHRSSTYISIMDDDGDMLVAMNDMTILKSMGADFVEERLAAINQATVCVCDGNLSLEAMELLLKKATVPVFCDPVSTAWAKNMLPVVHSFYTIKPNRMEAEVLAGMAITNEALLEDAANKLLKTGIEHVFISLGADGLFYKGRSGEKYHQRCRPLAKITNATGAGDAAMAGIIYGYLNNMSYKETVHFSLSASIIALQSNRTISDEMHPDMVMKMMKEYIL